MQFVSKAVDVVAVLRTQIFEDMIPVLVYARAGSNVLPGQGMQPEVGQSLDRVRKQCNLPNPTRLEFCLDREFLEYPNSLERMLNARAGGYFIVEAARGQHVGCGPK